MASSACLDPDTASSYVARALGPEEHARVDRHIDGCPTCRELVSLIARSAWSSGAGKDTTLASPGRAPGPGPRPELLPRGTRVGPYELRHPLSAGGMGVVYVGYDARLDRQLALKCVREHRGGTAEQLLNEARLMAQAAHPNVVPVHDVIDSHGQVFIAMELVVGRNLSQWLAEAPRSWRHIADVFLAAGEGLAAAHRLRIVHGDVKPLNILVGDDGRVRVTDFGIATLASAPQDLEVIRGTPAYFAPEQKAGRPADALSDQYAFAVSLHEALHGALPGAPTTKQTRVPLGVRRVLARGLAEAPGARFPSMEALLRALRAARQARWRQAAAGVTVTAALAAAAFAVGGRRAEAGQCAAAASELQSPWDARAKQRARDAFARTGLSYAGETLERVEARLDAWSLARDAALEAACQPGWLSRDVPLQRLQSQLACLKEATREARALVTQLGDADTAVVLHAVAMAEGLSPVARCAETARPAAPVSTGNGAVRDALAKAKALAAAGKYRDAVKVAQAAAKEADATDDLALRAAAKSVWGGEQALVGEYEAAAVTLGEAIRLAELSGEDRVRAHAWTDLIGVEYSRGRHDQVLFLGPAALGATQRVDDVRLTTEVMVTIGSSMSEKGRPAEAKAMLEDAVKLRAQAYGETDRRTSMALSALANAMAMGGDLDAAAAAHRRALAAAQAAFGAAHPEVGIVHMNLGDDYLYALKLDLAVQELGTAERTLVAANGPKNREALLAATDLGFAYLLGGERGQALAAFERAVAGWSEAFPTHPSRAMALLGRYQALDGAGDLKDLEAALAAIGDLPPFEAGRVQLELGIAKSDAKLVQGARENLSSVAMPLVAKALKRAEDWLAAR